MDLVGRSGPGNALEVYGEWQYGNHGKSLNGGHGWFTTMNGITGAGLFVTPVDQDQNSVQTLFTSSNAGIFRTTHGAGNWLPVAAQGAVWISISRASSDIVWTADLSGAWVSKDGGDSWSAAAPWGFPVGSLTKIHAHPIDERIAFATFSGYATHIAHIAIMTDLGATWENVTGDFPTMPVNVIVVDPLDPDAWYIGTDTGVWTSTNQGIHWEPFEAELPNVVVTDLEINIDARKLLAGTYGRGVWEVDLPHPGKVSDRTGTIATMNLMLDPPFPNPLTDRTTLRFAARHPADVELAIYDTSGRLVESIAGVRGDGIVRTATWSSEGVTDGVYLAVLRAGGERISQKLIVRR